MKHSDQPVRLVVTDLDNTLWDWVHVWGTSFRALLNEILRISGIDAEALKPSIRAVHQKHGTSEYAFLIQELDVLKQAFPDADVLDLFAPAIKAFRRSRTDTLRLYDGVDRALRELSRIGVRLVGYSESLSFYSQYRLRKTKLDEVLDALYCPADHLLPRNLTRDQIRSYDETAYRLKKTDARTTPRGELKPNPDVLRQILRDQEADIATTIYIGDSLMKDISMAQAVGVRDVHARYGHAQHREDYELLREVTHWTDADVERERRNLAQPVVQPTFTVDSFSDVLRLFRFEPFSENEVDARD